MKATPEQKDYIKQSKQFHKTVQNTIEMNIVELNHLHEKMSFLKREIKHQEFLIKKQRIALKSSQINLAAYEKSIKTRN